MPTIHIHPRWRRSRLVSGRTAENTEGRAFAAPARRVPPSSPACGRLSLVVATCGKWELTEACLRSLRADLPDAEVIVVDNGSSDGTVAHLLGDCRGLASAVIPNRENRGVAPAWNQGLRFAHGDLLGVLNNDTLINPTGMQRLAEAAWRTGIACHLGGKLNPDFSFRSYTTSSERSTYADGTCLLFRRDVWERVGAFDEGFAPAYSEDADWSLRARLAGYAWEILPDALVHLGSQTAQGMDLSEAQRLNRAYLTAKHYGLGVGERWLIRRWGACGDVVMATAAIAALRRQRPLARLELQCHPRFVEVVGDSGLLDGASDLPAGDYTHTANLDLAYEKHQAAGVWSQPAQAYAEVLKVRLQGDEPYAVTEAAELSEWAEVWLPTAEAGYVACGMRSVNRPKAQWHAQGWADLWEAEPSRLFVLLDTSADAPLSPFGEDALPNACYFPNVIDLRGHIPSLRHLVALLRRCQACVTVDTGVLHLAAAVGLPTVALMGGVPGAARRPLVTPSIGIDGAAPCFPCQSPSRCARACNEEHCLAPVTGEQAARALKEILHD